MSAATEEFYFTLRLTECEHDIVEHDIRRWAGKRGLKVRYYRQFKTGHVPTYRECKVVGPRETISRFKAWCGNRECPIEPGNYWQTEEWKKEKAWRALLTAGGTG